MRHLFLVTAAIVLLAFGGTAHAWELGWNTLDKPGAGWTYAYGIDGNNIVGTYYLGNPIDYKPYSSYLYDGSTWTLLNRPGAAYTEAFDIDGNNIVGTAYYGSGTGYYSDGSLFNGTTWTQVRLYSEVYGIDGNNIVRTELWSDGYHGLLGNGNTWITLTMPGWIPGVDPRDSGTWAHGISGGNVVGWYRGAPDYTYHGFFFNGTTWTTLDAPGAYDTRAYGIDGSNIVGYYANSTGIHGFLYNIVRATWTTLDAPPGLHVGNTRAFGIDGNNVVGTYWDASGNSHGFVYVVPEPGSLLGLSAGLFGLFGALRLRRLER